MRLAGLATGLVLLGLAAALVLTALEQNVVYFHTPADIRNGSVDRTSAFRLGGLVIRGSLVSLGRQRVRFDVTDFAAATTVEYEGLLPDLFREGQGVIAEGGLREDGTFFATRILAKHDENYMPPEVAEKLRLQHSDAGEMGAAQ
jgi:cytochrome c-type biogenesis protein CcmE